MKVAPPQPFRWPVRVYYEDTDAAGVVYYANYLRYLERARTEWLAAIGIAVVALEIEHNAVLVVHRLEIDYRQPAKLYDSLIVTLVPIEHGSVRFIVAHEVLRGVEILASARVTLACLTRNTWRPRPIPALVAANLERMENHG